MESGLECLRSRLGLEGFRSRDLSRDFAWVIFLWSLARNGSSKTDLQSNCSKFSCSNRSVAKLSLLLCYYGENNLPSTPFKICAEFNKNSVYQWNGSA